MQLFSQKIITEIIQMINEKLKQFYEDNMFLQESYGNSFEEVIEGLMENEIATTDAVVLKKLMTSKEKIRYNKKQRYLAKCQDMINDKYWEKEKDVERFCLPEVMQDYQNISDIEFFLKYKKDITAVLQENMVLIKQWASDREQLMIDYPGKDKQTPYSLCINFKIDLVIDILKTLKKLYNFDIDKQTLSYLEDLSSRSFFSVSKERIRIPKDGPARITFENQNSKTQTRITVDTSYTKNESIKLFDSIDSDLISFFVGKTIKATGYPIMIEEKEILRAIFPDRIPSEKDRTMITERIYKLTHTDIDRFVDGEWSGNIRILGEAQPHKNQGHRIWEYYPSQYIARQIEDGLIMNLPAEVKKELKNEVAKLLYLPFMQQRLRIYREIKSGKRKNVNYKAEFKYLELLRFVNFGYKKKKDGHKSFMDAIEEYKSIQRLIKSYTYSPVRDSYTIMFNELTEMEIMDFDRVFAKDMTEARKISNSILGQVLLSDNVVNEKTTK